LNRINNGLSVRELAKRVGISHGYLSKLERLDHAPSAELVSKIAGALNINIEELLFSEDEIDFLNHTDLSLEELKDKFEVTLDGKPLTDKELELAIKSIRELRSSSI